MAAMAQESMAFVPTVKCSSCGGQVEIAMMGEHVCSGPASSPPAEDSFDNFISKNGGAKPSSPKFGRPPQVDVDAANRPKMSLGVLTPPVSSGGSRSASPVTPNQRPIGDGRDDIYFPPLNLNTPPSQPQRPAANLSSSSSSSPMSAGSGAKLLLRMNTIAPGPFETRRAPGLQSDSTERLGTSALNASVGSAKSAPSRVRRKEGYDGFGPPQRAQEPPVAFNMTSRSDGYAQNRSPDDDATTPAARPGRSSSTPRSRPVNDSDPSRREAARGLSATRVAPPARPRSPSGAPSLSSSAPSRSSFASQSTRTGRSRTNTAGLDSIMSDLQSVTVGGGGGGENKGPSSQAGRLAPITSEPQQLPLSPIPSSPAFDPAVQGGSVWKSLTPSPPRGRDLISDDRPRGRETSPTPRGRPAPSRQATSRGTCMACGELIITGKSISSADGRLTGRYHKACFVCTTCRDPFPSCEFYVLNDRPYCAQHYHQLNGSLCASCSSGIEGQYIEDEDGTKHHAACFRCADCGDILRDGYFDVAGQALCEQDAWRRVQPSPAASPQPPSPPPPQVEQPRQKLQQRQPQQQQQPQRQQPSKPVQPQRSVRRIRQQPPNPQPRQQQQPQRPQPHVRRPGFGPTSDAPVNRMRPGVAPTNLRPVRTGTGAPAPAPANMRMQKRMTRLGRM